MKNLYLLLSFLLLQQYVYGNDAYVENKGQVIDQYRQPNAEVLYIYSGDGLNVQLRKTGFSYDTWQPGRNNTFEFHRLDINFVHSSASMQVHHAGVSADYLNYYSDKTPTQGINNIRSYQEAIYREVWPGIDIAFSLRDGSPKYDFIIKPGADLENIKLDIKGADNITITNGSLLLSASGKMIEEKLPYSYYSVPGKENTEVGAMFKLNNDGTYGISVSNSVPPGATLVIDPVPNTLWGTMYGGGGKDYGENTTSGPNGEIYMTGYTLSTTGIATSGAFKNTIAGDFDMFIARFTSLGIRSWATYYGGAMAEYPTDIALNAAGTAVYVAGYTYSDTGIASAGAHQGSYDADADLLLLKLDTAGQRVWCTYYGGNGKDLPGTISVDKDEHIYLAGATYSSNNIATPGAYKSTAPLDINTNSQSFLAKFNSSGNRLWGTYYGGSDGETMYMAGVFADSIVLVTGYTASDTGIATAGTYQPLPGGSSDLFIARFDSAGNFKMGTYFGDAMDEYTDYKGTIDDSGNIYIHGYTQSSTGMTTLNAHQTVFGGGGHDGVLAKFTPSLNRVWSTYYGGDGIDETLAIAIDKDHAIYLTGVTESTNNIATAGTWQDSNPFGGHHMFLAKFGNDGSQKWGTYLLGAEAHGANVDKDNDLLLSGWSSVATLGTPGTHQQYHNGGGFDGFLTKIQGCHKGFASASTSLLFFNQVGSLMSLPSGMFSYSWQHANGFTSDLQNPKINNPTITDTGLYIVTITDSAKCTDTASVHVRLIPWGYVNDAGVKTPFDIYPNPATSVIYIDNKMTTDALMSISTAEGRVVSSQELTPGKNSVNTQALAAGIYLINIHYGDKMETIKIQVQR